ncbi:hypothetical protein VKT23_002623 [Stygiomarasmius scandens]|uniref:Uncharacterized protein n=1 Tax=Marasmiellus scandens TaxID=2682957 RepID=A0ABR1K5A0_9AGAR
MMFMGLLAFLAFSFQCNLLSASFLPLQSSVGFLQTRQINIPPACTDTCGTAPQQVQSCTPDTCCNNQFDTTLSNCYRCVGSAMNISDYSLPQQILDQLFNICAAAGSPVDEQTLPGQDPNRPLSSAPPVPSSTSSQDSTAVSSSPSLSSGSSTVRSVSSQSTVVSSPTSSSTPRSPVTETSSIVETTSSGGAQPSQTDNNAGKRKSRDVNLPLLVSIVGVLAVTFSFASCI